MNVSEIFLSLLNAAIYWYSFGLAVIPIIPGTKLPAIKWDPWLDALSHETISSYWDQHPDHEIGCIVSEDVIVFDADSPAAIASLALLEETFDVTPNLTVTTSKGQHHYFKRAPGTYAKSDSHSTEKHPERIDVKTGRALVVLPPSTGKEVDIQECENAAELTEATQALIDAVFRQNGREAPRLPVAKTLPPSPLPADMDQATAQLKALLVYIYPDCGYDDWVRVLMALHHETGGSDDGLALADDWCSRGDKYPGADEIANKWHSFENYTGDPVTVGTLRNMVADNGFDWIDVCSRTEPDFEPCEFVTVHPDQHLTVTPTVPRNPLVDCSLRGMWKQLADKFSDQVLILGLIILMYQSSVIYAAPNTGKTLIILWLLIIAIKEGKIVPSNIFYINVDDTPNGLIEKLKLADEHGLHMLAEGYNDFKADDLLGILANLVNSDQCKDVILILDTLKKFTDLMDKKMSSRFGKVIRRFFLHGGTCISLAHTNKHRNSDGKPVYAGTTDIIDDADCVYLMYEVGIDVDAKTKTILFENVKSRGNVARQASYRYGITEGLSYRELFDSVEPVDDTELVAVKQAQDIKSDTDIINAVTACIADGINTKMRLRDAVSDRIGCSKRAAI